MKNGNGKFIIPQKDGGIIAELEDGFIKEIGKIDVPCLSKNVFLKNRLFVSICLGIKPKSRRLKIFDEFGQQLFRNTEYKFSSINCKDTTVYLGGQYKKNKGELFSFIDLSDANFKIKEIELPIKTIEGKAIDDILIRDEILYLVDNVVYPKYIFTYDIGIAANPKHIGTYALKNNGTYEHIRKGDINKNWIVLFSSTVGMNGAFQHISIIGKDENWQEHTTLSFCVERYHKDRLSGKDKKKREEIWDICLIENSLLLLKEHGLFCIDLTNKKLEKKTIKINNNENKYDMFLKISDEKHIVLNNEKYKLLVLK
jgi:hypothetical protein